MGVHYIILSTLYMFNLLNNIFKKEKNHFYVGVLLLFSGLILSKLSAPMSLL